MPNVLFAGLSHETHTFLRQQTTPDDFRFLRGHEIPEVDGNGSTLSGGLEVAREHGWNVLPAIHMAATPSGTVSDSVLDMFWDGFLSAVRSHSNKSLDGIWLDLHGAMASETYPDVEGRILSLIRKVEGFARIPICCVLDLHGNITPEMASSVTGMAVYRENPHTDAHDAARRSAEILDRLMQRHESAITLYEQPPLLLPPTATGTADEPMRTLERKARELESQNPDFLAVNVFAGFSFADAPHAGVSFTITTVGKPADARRALTELSALAMSGKQAAIPQLTPLTDALDRVAAASAGPIVLVEPADNIGGGAPGDLTIVLKGLLERGIRNSAVCLDDPESVAALRDRSIGDMVDLLVGGKSGEIAAEPLQLRVTLVSRSDGTYKLEDPNSHAAMWGIRQDMGQCAVIEAHGITILLTSRKTPPFDLGQWRSQGLNPESFHAINVKAAVAHRRAYEKIQKQSITLDTPGPCAENLRRLPYTRIRRPVFPLDDI